VVEGAFADVLTAKGLHAGAYR